KKATFFMTQRRIYQDIYPYHLTFNTKEGVPFFENVEKAELLYITIMNVCEKKKYVVVAFSILPNHIHMMIQSGIQKYTPQLSVAAVGHNHQPSAGTNVTSAGTETRAGGCTISDLIYSIKSYYCYQLRKMYSINYSPWQKRFNFRIVDSERRYLNTLNYIINNHKKHGLPEKYGKAPYVYYG
ncbi:MAG: transposase, partial [Patescibacteria group bacterium]